jgi:hypothetical protein
MPESRRRATVVMATLLTAAAAAVPRSDRRQEPVPLAKALTFYASFDGTTRAAFAAGDPAIYWAPTFKQRHEGRSGLPDTGTVELAAGAGRAGDALRFTARKSPVVFYNGARNMPFRNANWSGTVSFWLSTDPAGALEPGFCDPVPSSSSRSARTRSRSGWASTPTLPCGTRRNGRSTRSRHPSGRS